MADLRQIFKTINVQRGTFVDDEGSNLGQPGWPILTFNEKIILCAHFINEDGTDYVLDPIETLESSVDIDYDHATALMCYSGNSLVNVAGDWDDIDDSQGKRSIRIYANTGTNFTSKLTDKFTNCLIEIKKFNSGNESILLQDGIRCRNTVNNGDPTPEESDPDYKTDSYNQSYYQSIVKNTPKTLDKDTPTDILLADSSTRRSVGFVSYIYDASGNYNIVKGQIIHDGTNGKAFLQTFPYPNLISGIAYSVVVSGGSFYLRVTLSGHSVDLNMVYGLTDILAIV